MECKETPLFWFPLTCAGIGRNSPQVAANVVVQAELVHNARQENPAKTRGRGAPRYPQGCVLRKLHQSWQAALCEDLRPAVGVLSRTNSMPAAITQSV
jgi:hypothetical protein